MTQDTKTIGMPDSGVAFPEQAKSRKPYDSPQLQEWGSIVELTGGTQFQLNDADFNGGSGGT
jgi:hypothetical protein